MCAGFCPRSGIRTGVGARVRAGFRSGSRAGVGAVVESYVGALVRVRVGCEVVAGVGRPQVMSVVRCLFSLERGLCFFNCFI